MKHTPAPWTVSPDAECETGFFSVWHDKGGTGTEIAGRIGEEANARLIASAPDLLAALEDCAKWAVSRSGMPEDDDAAFKAISDNCLLAISLAKGDA